MADEPRRWWLRRRWAFRPSLSAATIEIMATCSGVLGQVWNRPIIKIKVSTSAKALVVIGVGLTPGASGYGEIVRAAAPAAGVFDFDFGEGLPPGTFGSGNSQWVYWSDTAGG